MRTIKIPPDFIKEIQDKAKQEERQRIIKEIEKLKLALIICDVDYMDSYDDAAEWGYELAFNKIINTVLDEQGEE